MISVIIPVYNGERFISQCYESLKKQSIKDWEAVFINDGSRDNSYSLLKDLAKLDSRLKILDKENEGVAVAREYGIRVATNEIVTFLDVDDTLESNALETFISSFTSDNIDVVFSGINIVSEEGEIIDTISYRRVDYGKEDCLNLLSDGRLRWQVWAKAFRKKLFKDVLVPTGLRIGEDMAVCFQTIAASRRIRVLNDCLYNYVQLESSVTHKRNDIVTLEAFKAINCIEKSPGLYISNENLDCIYLLVSSSSLRMGVSPGNKVLRGHIKSHLRIKHFKRITMKKTLNLILAYYFHINIAKFL